MTQSTAVVGRPVVPVATGCPQATAALLARFEARRIARHPAFLVGLAFTLYVTLSSTAGSMVADSYINLTGLALMPLGLGTLLASHLGAVRARRAGAEELLTPAPTSPVVRTTGHLLAVAGAFAFALALSAAGAALGAAWGVFALRPPGLAEFLQGPLAVAGAGMLGVALARWLPNRAVLIPLSIGLMAWNVILLGSGATWFKPTVDLVVYQGDGSYGWDGGIGGFLDGSVGMHCLALAGLAGVVASLALLRHGRTRAIARLLVLSVVATLAGGVLQLP